MNIKANGAKTSSAGSWPDFVTTADLSEASELEREFHRLMLHRAALSSVPIKEKFKQAKVAYLEWPTDENFETMKALATEVVIVEEPTTNSYSTLRALVHGLICDRLVSARFVPWAQAIVDRGLTQARANLADVIAREEAHYLEQVGEALGQKSTPIIEKARTPICELEKVLASLKGNAEHAIFSFLHFLRTRAAAQEAGRE